MLQESLRQEYLKAMGIDLWLARDHDELQDEEPEAAPVVAELKPAAISNDNNRHNTLNDIRAQLNPDKDPAHNRPAENTAATTQAVTQQAPPAYTPATPPQTKSAPAAIADLLPQVAEAKTQPSPSAQPLVDLSAFNLDQLNEHMQGCQLCDLHETRSNVVVGTGHAQADILIIGEAPGEQEDLKGRPFAGPSGDLLELMLKAIGTARDQVYISNALKCRPPGGRNPHVGELQNCQAYLWRQIELIKPKLIVAVGGVAAKTLLNTKKPVGQLRGIQHQGPHNIPLIVTYHPAYLLRNPSAKAAAWLDLKTIADVAKLEY